MYFLLSHVAGARVGAALGICYCFGMAVACSLYTVGFGESVTAMITSDKDKAQWLARVIAAAVVLVLLCINMAGVKWVIRLQLLLLVVLLIAVLDFLVGSFVHTDPENGFVGYNSETFKNNSHTDYMEGESFFTVLGVFFPTATGVFAGINMSGDLRNPRRNIPVGTIPAMAVSTFLYLIFAFALGATCLRGALQSDYMVAEKVSVLGFLFLAGLYISSISSCMGGLYGAPRILQCIANDEIIPFIRVLGKGRGPNNLPVYALLVTTIITLIFIFVGKVNTLGPIVTLPFMLTYASVDYAYFSLVMSYDIEKANEERFHKSHLKAHAARYQDLKHDDETAPAYSASFSRNGGQNINYGSPKKSNDLDDLFPERVHSIQRRQLQGQGSRRSPTLYSEGKEEEETPEMAGSDVGDTSELVMKRRYNKFNSIQFIPKASIACLVYKGNTYITYGRTAIQYHLLYNI